MGIFRRKGRILDLTKHYEKQQARAEEMKEDLAESRSSSGTDAGGLGFFGAIANTAAQDNSSEPEYVDVSSGIDEKRRKLAKRLIEMTNKLEDLSNQIYHLQQRIEVLEKRSGVGGY